MLYNLEMKKVTSRPFAFEDTIGAKVVLFGASKEFIPKDWLHFFVSIP